jgi:hypothetical protein
MAERGTARRVARWLADSPDAATQGGPIRVNPTSTPIPGTPVPATASGRPRKAERRRVRKAEFFAARRRQATTPLARLEVAVDELRALQNERALVEATTALDAIVRRFTP